MEVPSWDTLCMEYAGRDYHPEFLQHSRKYAQHIPSTFEAFSKRVLSLFQAYSKVIASIFEAYSMCLVIVRASIPCAWCLLLHPSGAPESASKAVALEAGSRAPEGRKSSQLSHGIRRAGLSPYVFENVRLQGGG